MFLRDPGRILGGQKLSSSFNSRASSQDGEGARSEKETNKEMTGTPLILFPALPHDDGDFEKCFQATGGGDGHLHVQAITDGNIERGL